MKFKNIMLTALLLLTILTVGAVSAADGNATSEDIGVENDVEDAIAVSDGSDVMGDDEDSMEIFNVSLPDEVTEGIPFKVTFTGASDLVGNIEVFASEEYSVPLNNGSASFTLNLESGVNEVEYAFNEQYYDSNYGVYVDANYHTSSFNVTVKDLFEISMPESIFEGETVKVTFTAPRNIKGELQVDYGMDDYVYATVKNGKATVSLKNFPKVKSIKYMFDGDMMYLEKSIPVNVFDSPKIKADNFKTLYSSKKQYKVQILDNKSKPVGEGKTVTFELYGYDYKKDKTVKMATKTVTTDKNGYAKVCFNLAPDTYTVKIKYPHRTVTKKYVIDSIIKPKQIYKKHSRIKSVTAKRFEFGASLKKVDGKVLKGKNVKFTFYRQDYKGKINSYYWGRLSVIKTLNLKTNSKGVAKKTYTKLPFKVTKDELAGVTIFVKISYGKDEQWVNFNVYSLSPIKYYFI